MLAQDCCLASRRGLTLVRVGSILKTASNVAWVSCLRKNQREAARCNDWQRWTTAAVTAIELLIRFLRDTSSFHEKKKRKTKWLSLMTAIDKSNLKAVTTFLSLAPWKHVSKDSLILRQASKRIPRKCDWGVYVNLTKHAFLTIFLNAFAKT